MGKFASTLALGFIGFLIIFGALAALIAGVTAAWAFFGPWWGSAATVAAMSLVFATGCAIEEL